MRATTDVLDAIEPLQTTNGMGMPPQVAFPGVIAPRSLRRKPQEKWSSSLAPDDLRRLLAVLETQLIPQLVGAYSPALGAAPLPSAATDG